ncbi:MAG: hypothetical protein PHT69_07945 [Bacteroidales bacterium]|nr:hypothetical protein [Bacteroidales bacterium]
MSLKIAHIVNIFKPDYNSDLYTAQPITLESMRVAKNFSDSEISIDLFSAHYPEDNDMVPSFFLKTTFLELSVTNRGKFKTNRKLPLISEILQKLYEASDAEYFIYTNNDIILLPFFYKTVKQIIEQGHDAFIINRRRISSRFNKIEDLPLIYAECGKKHPGFDCFVFKREIFPKMHLDNICIGVPFIGVTLAHNLFCFARNFKLFDDLHITTHIGLDIMGHRTEYYWHNRKAFNQNVKKLMPYLDISKFPYYEEPFIIRYYKWGANPSLFVFMNFKMEIKRLLKKIKLFFNRFV